MIQGQDSVSEVGQASSAGFIQLCQTGDSSLLVEELKANPKVKYVETTEGPLFPASSTMATIHMKDVARESVHFAAMYGLTKDACAVIDLTNIELARLLPSSYYEYHRGIRRELRGTDRAVSTGAFSDPMITDQAGACEGADSAIGCIRELAVEMEGGSIRAFRPYLPSLLHLLESRFGSGAVQPLIVPNGAIQFSVRLGNHY